MNRMHGVPSRDELFAMFLLNRELDEKELPRGLGRTSGDDAGRSDRFEYALVKLAGGMLGLAGKEAALVRRLARMSKKAYFFE